MSESPELKEAASIELREALAEFRLASARFATASPFDLDNAMDAADSASRAVQALYDRQREEIEEAGKILAAALDRDESKWDESLRVLASLASNGIYWRDKEIASLSSQLEQFRRGSANG